MQKRASISLNHLDRMTDSTGLIQHAIYDIPRRMSGYTTDDNARALRLCARLWRRRPTLRMLARVTKYLSFMEYARCAHGRFHNFMNYRRRWLDKEGSDDCLGQSVLALAEVLGSGLPDGHRAVARELIDAAVPILADVRSLRAQGYLILAWGHLRTAGVDGIEPLERISWTAARRLVECFERFRKPEWPWFESKLTYANAVLPHALFVAAQHWSEPAFADVGEATFSFLETVTTADGDFWPIGNAGWYSHRGNKAAYDQQPVEASTMGDAALAAFSVRNDERSLATFQRARDWFHGKNSLGLPLVEVRRGACCDAIQPSGLNQNQGAESTLAFLWTELRAAGNHHKPTINQPVTAAGI